jgi:tetratricopeptide (TPR) repeat protein
VQLITHIVGEPSDWGELGSFPQVGVPVVPGQEYPEPGTGRNNLAFYPPAMALVVKGTSRIQTRALPPPLTTGGPPIPEAALPRDKKIRVDGSGEERPGDSDRVAAAKQDPAVIWQDALAKGVEDPGLIIACSDFLALTNHWDHAAELLKANLRQGIVVRPWVYEALAVALRETRASAEEIERAELSAADLEPLDAGGFLKAAQAQKAQKRYDRALALCRQAALRDPHAPEIYTEALRCARLARDSSGMAWAASHLLRQDWSTNNHDLHLNAVEQVTSLARTLAAGNRNEEAERLLANVERYRQRDLVVRLSWEGEADLDLKVQEPCGSISTPRNRQTVGGGTLIGDRLAGVKDAAAAGESYIAACAFPGEYTVTIDRIWGQPLGNKAQLRVIRHQGTSEEREEIITLDLGQRKTATIRLDNGRRSELAVVPLPHREEPRQEVIDTGGNTARVLGQLRNLAYNEVTSVDTGFRGGFLALGTPVRPSAPDRQPDRGPSEHVVYQTRVSGLVSTGTDLTAQLALSADGRQARLSLSAYFDALAGKQGRPVVRTAVVPGGERP